MIHYNYLDKQVILYHSNGVENVKKRVFSVEFYNFIYYFSVVGIRSGIPEQQILSGNVKMENIYIGIIITDVLSLKAGIRHGSPAE